MSDGLRYITESTLAALANVAANPLRSFLTSIGIIIGIASVIVVIAIGEGNREVIQQKIKQMGANILAINVYAAEPEINQGGSAAPLFIDEQAIHTLRSRASLIEAISPLQSIEGEFKFRSVTSTFMVNGTYPDYQKVRRLTLVRGRYFSLFEERHQSRVCVITESLAKRLGVLVTSIPDVEIHIDCRKYKVIGMVRDLPMLDKNTKAEQAFIPFSVLKKEMPFVFMDTVYLTITESADVLVGLKQVRGVLHQLYGEKSNGWVKEMADLLKSEKAITTNTTLMIVGVASLSLFVGGIGVMNIMLVSVKERVRKIGIRKALGATDMDVLGLFLLEGIVLCFLGGVAGVLLGVVAVQFIALTMNIPAKISLLAVGVSMLFSTGVGIFFSLYPAI